MEISQHLPVLWFTGAILALYLLGVVGSTNVDLKCACTGASAKFCVLTNVTSSFEDPLKVINSSVPELEQLIMHNSAVGGIPNVIFEQTPHLEAIIMHNCGLNRLAIGDFRDVSQLKKLALQNNRLFNIPENAFIELRGGLVELYLGHNAIHIVHRRAFTGLNSLQYLEVQHNVISSLHQGLFDDLSNLQHIDLSHNELEVIDIGTFAKNAKLSTVLLSHNKFTVFEPSSLNHLPHLRLLDLSHTVLEELCVQSVDVLLVQDSGLKSCIINGGVITLNAETNSLRGLNISDALSVRDLYLYDNKMETLDDLAGMLNLQRLDVSKNQLTSLRSSSSPLYLPWPNLEYINLSSNQLQNITLNDFILMTKLTTVDLAFNNISHLEAQVFQSLIDLQKLYLEGNHLQHFNYKELQSAHGSLLELGIVKNSWGVEYLEKMVKFLLQKGVLIPTRVMQFNSPGFEISRDVRNFPDTPKRLFPEMPEDEYVEEDDDDDHNHEERLVGLSGIHPYWTLRDILSLITLIVVLFILLLQFYHIVQEEGWCRCVTRNTDDDDATQPLNARHRLLVDDNSSV